MFHCNARQTSRSVTADRRHILRGLALSMLAVTAAKLRPAQAATASQEDARALLAGGGAGLVVAMRHALAPGTFDPPGFRLDACGTQRNLSAQGQDQARRIGAWYRARGLTPRAVRSSQWCRCLETAHLAFGGSEPWPALNSFVGEPTQQAARLAALRTELARLRQQAAPGFEVWVTHQVNISALSDNPTGSGEAVLLRHDPASGQPRVLATLRLE